MIDVKLIRLVTGEEIIAELISEDENSITVKNGLVVIPNGQGVGFAQWATVIDPDNPEVTVKQQHVVYIVPVQEDVSSKYNEMFGSKLVTPGKKKLIV